MCRDGVAERTVEKGTQNVDQCSACGAAARFGRPVKVSSPVLVPANVPLAFEDLQERTVVEAQDACGMNRVTAEYQRPSVV